MSEPWLYVIPNLIIALSYFIIPVAIGLLMLLNPNLPNQWVAMLFIAFIVACGLTHAGHVAGIAWISLVFDWVCAVLSIATAIAMAFYVKQLHGFLVMVAEARSGAR